MVRWRKRRVARRRGTRTTHMTKTIVRCTDVSEYVAAVLRTGARERRFIPVLAEEADGRLQELAAFANTVVMPWRSLDHETAASPAEEALVSELATALDADAKAERTRALLHIGNSLEEVDPASHEGRDVVVAVHDEYALVGAALARLEGRPFCLVDSLAAIAARTLGARSVAIVGSPVHFTSQAIGALIGYEGAFASGTMRVPFGILTGHSRSSLARTIAKKFLYRRSRGETAKLLSVFDRPVRERIEGPLEILSLMSLTAEKARRLLDESFDLVTIGTHGDPIDADLNEAVLCGRPSRKVPGRRSLSQVHTCTHEDHCPRNRDGKLPRIAIDSLRSRLLAIETCTGVGIADGLLPSSLSLSLGALEGHAAALLSTTKIIRGTAVGPLLIPLLAQSGMPFGEICETMKLAHVGISGDVPSFVLLGDPTLRLDDNSSPQPSIAGTILLAPRPGDATPRWTISADFAPGLHSLVRIDVSGSVAESVARLEDVVLEELSANPADPELDGELTAIVLRGVFGTPFSVLLFSPRPFEFTTVRLSLVEDRDAREKVERTIEEVEGNLFLMRTIQKAAANARGVLATPEREKQATDLSMAIAEIEGILTDATTALHARRFPVHTLPLPWSTPDVSAWLAAKLAALDAGLASLWPTWNMRHFLVPQYGDTFVARGPERTVGPCYLCGGSLFEVTMRAQRRPALSRTVSHCGRCVIVSDRPSNEAIVEVRGPHTVRPGERLALQLHVTNTSTEARSFAAAGSIEGAYAWFRGHVEPTSAATLVPAAGTSELNFEVVIGESTTAGTYNCVFMTTSRAGINVSVKPIRVTA